MSILDAGGASAPTTTASEGQGTGAATATTATAATEGKTVDALNQEFQRANGGEHANAVLTPEAKAADPSAWYYDDNTPGTGERPEWLQPKFKSVADAAKSFNELEKKFGSFKGAPEAYDTAIPEMPDFKFEEGDPMLAEFLDLAKKSNASQDFVTKALSHYVNSQNFYAPDPQAELEKIGLNAKAEIAQLSEWAGQRLDKNEYEIFKSMVTTADSFKVLQKLRRAATSTPEVAVDTTRGQQSNQLSERQLLEMIADERFNKDPLFRAEVEAKAQKVWG
jgi:hypothetical protein